MKRLLTIYMIVLLIAGVTGLTASAYHYEPVKAQIEVQVKLGGRVTIIPDSGSPVPAKTEREIRDGETGRFDIDFTSPGVYGYTVRNLPDDRDLIFDKTVYRIEAYVDDEEGELVLTLVISKGEEKYGSDTNHLLFVNTMPGTEPSAMGVHGISL